MSVWLMIFIVALSLTVGYIGGRLLPRKEEFDGTLEVSERDASQIHTLEIDTNPDQLRNRDIVRFKVKKIVSDS